MSDDRPKKTDLMEWLDPKGSNFCGSGMTMEEWLLAGEIEKYLHAFTRQDRPEQKRRMHFIFEMVVEARKIQEAHGQFVEGKWYVASGAFMDSAISALIRGDRKDLKSAQGMYSPEAFKWNYGEGSGWERWAGIYANFYELCEQALATWPEEGKAQA